LVAFPCFNGPLWFNSWLAAKTAVAVAAAAVA